MAQADSGSARHRGQRLIFWDFPRASWQYDIVVGLILIFIFATPREWFHDQPKASSVVLMSSSHGSNRVFIATDLLGDVLEGQRATRAEALIRQRTGKSWHVIRVEPIRDEAEQEIKGFIAYTAP
ncbi:MAG: hypothetical protein JO051_16205 [Acidobacteriaceae bacterium]|nr:hypothetical protein [Acidobacteriaceae bacterium]